MAKKQSGDDAIEQKVAKELEKLISDKLRIIKAFFYGFTLLITLIVGWSLFDKADLIRTIHDKIFPNSHDDVLVTAYSGTFVLKASEELKGTNSSAYLTFRAKQEEKIKYYLSVTHQFSGSRDDSLRQFFLELDNNRIHPKAIKTHGGGLHPLTINAAPDPESEPDIHKLIFRLNQGQVDWLKIKDEITITCIILVYGKNNEVYNK